MTRFVIDASIAVKWIVEEQGTLEALALRQWKLAAPDLIVCECANILWKKRRLGQLTTAEASIAAQLLERADIECVAMGSHLYSATALALDLDHPAYDCFYLILALERGCPLVTADQRLVQKVRNHARPDLTGTIMSLAEAAASA